MSSDENKLRAVMILDMIGKPASHLIESMERVIEEIDKEQGISVKVKDIKEPKQSEENKEFYTTFAEVEFEADDILYLTVLLFKYMPAHVEIISPELIGMSNGGLSGFLSEVVRRLHAYDEVARIMQAEKRVILNELKEKGIEYQDLMKSYKDKKKDKEEENQKKEEKKI